MRGVQRRPGNVVRRLEWKDFEALTGVNSNKSSWLSKTEQSGYIYPFSTKLLWTVIIFMIQCYLDLVFQ